jgi:hypothetical protein
LCGFGCAIEELKKPISRECLKLSSFLSTCCYDYHASTRAIFS